MTDTLLDLQRKMSGAEQLASVVHTMKMLAASAIGQYETAVNALADYHHNVELGLLACLRQSGSAITPVKQLPRARIGIIVFGSDQGLVGQYNETLCQHVRDQLASSDADRTIWVVGERMQGQLQDVGIKTTGCLSVPTSVQAIAPLVVRLLHEMVGMLVANPDGQVWTFHHRPLSGVGYEPVCQHVLPLDAAWHSAMAQKHWPTALPPQIVDALPDTLRALLHEYLFVSLCRACAESLASENASRLAAMQRAEKNIDDLLAGLGHQYHQQRQAGIDEELFDLVAGFEAFRKPDSNRDTGVPSVNDASV